MQNNDDLINDILSELDGQKYLPRRKKKLLLRKPNRNRK